jgi:hypothetical protein
LAHGPVGFPVSFHDLAGITQQVPILTLLHTHHLLSHLCFTLNAMQANSGNLNNFIHAPTHEFLEGRVRKAAADAPHDDASHNRDEVEVRAEEVPAPPPQLAVEVDPQLVQAGK